MVFSARAALVLVVTLALTGCATVPKQQFNRATNQDIKTVAVLSPAGTDEYQVRNLGHAGNAFGLVGALIAEADISSKSNKFTAAMKQRNYSLLGEFRDRLESELKTAGYEVEMVTVARAEESDFLKSYDAVTTQADAILDLTVNSGYFCASGATDYIPYVRSDVQFVKRETREIVYREIVSYGYTVPYDQNNNAISIAADKQHFFTDFDALMLAPDKALSGMRTGIPLVAQQIAKAIAPATAHAP